MMESTQNGEGENLATFVIWWIWYDVRFWYLLLDPLMRTGLVEGMNIRVEYALELLLMEDEQMIETLSPHTSKKAFTNSIRSGCLRRCFENLDPTRVRNPCPRIAQRGCS